MARHTAKSHKIRKVEILVIQMTKDVLVKISGLQFAEDQDNGPVEIITTGNYYKKNGKHYILYDEVQEGFDGVTKSVIKVNDDFLFHGSISFGSHHKKAALISQSRHVIVWACQMTAVRRLFFFCRRPADRSHIAIGYD